MIRCLSRDAAFTPVFRQNKNKVGETIMKRLGYRRSLVSTLRSLCPGVCFVAIAALLAALAAISVNAQNEPPKNDPSKSDVTKNDPTNDEGYSKKIREYTTEPFFLTNLVDHLPAST